MAGSVRVPASTGIGLGGWGTIAGDGLITTGMGLVEGGVAIWGGAGAGVGKGLAGAVSAGLGSSAAGSGGKGGGAAGAGRFFLPQKISGQAMRMWSYAQFQRVLKF
jgi:hypothetical protein